jgi:hypothetical protein
LRLKAKGRDKGLLLPDRSISALTTSQLLGAVRSRAWSFDWRECLMTEYVVLGVCVGCLVLVIASNLARRYRLAGFWGTLLRAEFRTNYGLWAMMSVALFVVAGFYDPLTGEFAGEFKLWVWYQGFGNNEAVRLPIVGLVVGLLLAFWLVFYALLLIGFAAVGGWVLQGILSVAVGWFAPSAKKVNRSTEPNPTDVSPDKMPASESAPEKRLPHGGR